MLNQSILREAYRLMCTARAMAATYEQHRQICRYVHSVSSGHEAIQLATAMHLLPCDFISPYYRDDSLLLGLGFTPYQLMLQLLAKKDDIFSAGREYYAHPSYRAPDKPGIIHQSSATGMQAIPATGIAQGISLLEEIKSAQLKRGPQQESPVVVCSMGDASITEGEVSEAFQFAVLKKLPIIFLVQDNRWGISVTADEARAMDAYTYAGGFPGMERIRLQGFDFTECYTRMARVIEYVRKLRGPYLVQASVPLLGHHTSGVRKEFYRSEEDLAQHSVNDPLAKLRIALTVSGAGDDEIKLIEEDAASAVAADFEKAVAAPDPEASAVTDFVFAPTPVTNETGIRNPEGANKVLMVDAALFAIREIMEDNPEAVLFGQDVGRRLGGVFREAATLALQFGDHRVFNTAIQEAYIVGSTAGLSAVGIKPIVEIQFADYIYPAINQLVSEIAKSCYLTAGKYPVQTLIRVPVGAYGGGGPYHSGSIESTLLSIKGIKVVYPSNAADMKGLMKAAFYDPNPVIMLEHKGLYWSKVSGTDAAKTPEPDRAYTLPLGKANFVLHADEDMLNDGNTCVIITYGMGVYWALKAAEQFEGQVEILDLRTLFPLDEEAIMKAVKKHGKCLVLSEEQQNNSFAEALSGRISLQCFQSLDAPVQVLGALNLPAVPMNVVLEEAMLPNPTKVAEKIDWLLSY